jgi:hypothetical protein
VRLQCSRNRRTADAMPEILQGPSDSRVSASRILFGHPHDQPPDLHEHARPTRSSCRVRPFTRDEPPMPAQNGPRLAFAFPFSLTIVPFYVARRFAVTDDGQRLLAVRPDERRPLESNTLQVIRNRPQEVTAILAAGK